MAISQQCKAYQNSMDGTRVIHIIKLYENEYLVLMLDCFKSLAAFQNWYQQNKSKNMFYLLEQKVIMLLKLIR